MRCAVTQNTLTSSELILNPDGGVYHLNLLPEDVADTIILVGDPNRVAEVSRYFDCIEVKKSKREFVTHTGTIGHKRLSVVGTGIGAGNIDIAMNELDALFNIDLKNRLLKESHHQLRFVRLGTSGALRPTIPVDSCIISSFGVGLDAVVMYYDWQNNAEEAALSTQCKMVFNDLAFVDALYAAQGAKTLVSLFEKHGMGQLGITLTCPGFYGAQDRQLRAKVAHPDFLSLAKKVHFNDVSMTNLEMETAAIYGMARLLNHEACSISAIIANREQQIFSQDPQKTIDRMIQKALEILVQP